MESADLLILVIRASQKDSFSPQMNEKQLSDIPWLFLEADARKKFVLYNNDRQLNDLTEFEIIVQNCFTKHQIPFFKINPGNLFTDSLRVGFDAAVEMTQVVGGFNQKPAVMTEYPDLPKY